MAYQVMETDGWEETWMVCPPVEDKKKAYKAMIEFKSNEWKKLPEIKELFGKEDPSVYDWYVHHQSDRIFYLQEV